MAGSASANGPAADYPVVIGEPYSIDGTLHTPVDTLNYDRVGYLTLDDGAPGFSGAHHTLPVPSYVEVTALDTGRTILVRLERRGPMDSNHVVALSPAALEQLGAAPDTPVRVRRTNPPEGERFLLRSDVATPLRMDTPRSLLTVLERRLPDNGTASLRAAAPNPASAAPVASREVPHPLESVEVEASTAMADPAPAVVAAPTVAAVIEEPDSTPALPPVDSPPPGNDELAEPTVVQEEDAVPAQAVTEPAEQQEGRFVVQAAAFSTIERAQRVADEIGGNVTQAGRFYRVRTGPFATRGEAEASLANVRRAGYTDARIYTNG